MNETHRPSWCGHPDHSHEPHIDNGSCYSRHATIELPPRRVRRQKEASLRDRIRAAVCRLEWAAVWPNDQGGATYFGEAKDYHVRYGMGEGSPDLVGIASKLIRDAGRYDGVDIGIFLGIEVKNPGADKTHAERKEAQAQWRDRIERMGGIYIRATSVEETIQQLKERTGR